MRVLLVDDDPCDQVLAMCALEQWTEAPEVHAVCSGELAQEVLSAGFAPDLILLDGRLPKASGVEVLAWIRAQPALAGLPVFLLSSSTDPLEIKRAEDAGASGYLVKESDHERLTTALAGLEILVRLRRSHLTGAR